MELTHAYIRVEDFKNIRSEVDTKLIVGGFREDGSVIVARRGVAGRLISWIKSHLGRRDSAAEALAQIFCRQIAALGTSGQEALSSSGIKIENRDIKLNQARLALKRLAELGISPKRSEAAIFSLSAKNLHQVRTVEIDAIQKHIETTPATRQYLDTAVSNLQSQCGQLSTSEKSLVNKLTTWLAAERSLKLIDQYPDIPLDTLRQKALLEISNELETGSSQSIRTLLFFLNKRVDTVPRYTKELAGTIPEDQFLNFAWLTYQANLNGSENVSSLFRFILDRMIETAPLLPEMFSPEDLWVHCFDSHPKPLDTVGWCDAFYTEIDKWVIQQLPTKFVENETKRIEAQTLFATSMELLGLSSNDAIDLIVNSPKDLHSDQARYGLKLTNEPWATKTLDQCKKIVASDIKRLYSNPKAISIATIELEDGSESQIELDNTATMNELEKKAFTNGALDNNPVLSRLELVLKRLCVSESQLKGVLSGISANSQVIFVPISSIFNPAALTAGKTGLAGEHNACLIHLKRSGNDVCLSLKPLAVDWLDCEIEYRIGASGEGVLTHYHARTSQENLTNTLTVVKDAPSLTSKRVIRTSDSDVPLVLN